MKIRDIILVLTVGLGLALILVAFAFLREELAKLDTARRWQASNTVREELLVASTALARERTKTYLRLTIRGGLETDQNIAALRAEADQALHLARAALEGRHGHLQQASQTVAALARAQRQMLALRAYVDRAADTNDPDGRAEAGSIWLTGATQLIDDLQASRLTLLDSNRPSDAILSAEANIRAFVDILHEAVAFNEAVGVALLLSDDAEREDHQSTIERTIGRMTLAWQMLENELGVYIAPELRTKVEEVRSQYRQGYDPAQNTLIGAVPAPASSFEGWERTSDVLLNALGALQRALLDSSRRRLEALVADAQRSGALVGFVTLAGAVAALLILMIVRRRVINPLAQISQAMVRLADNDMMTPVPRAERMDEVGAMTNALRTFKANALQRQRTQKELQQVHHNLQEAYAQLRRDLEAAATIQVAMLPAPATVRGVRHTGLYAPSSLVAGDTYNVIALPSGGVGFFQIDVAGHGAAAALVSVAGQHTLSQALLTRGPETRLEDIAATVNHDWPEDLPYFTTIFGEIDAARPIGRIVQAGHPSPILIRSDGVAAYLGDSGFPIGMLPQARYETLEFAFASGDRLLIYSDGVIEAENQVGELYSEGRLLDVIARHSDRPTAELLQALQASLRSWRGRNELTDDVSVLVVERTNSWSIAHADH